MKRTNSLLVALVLLGTFSNWSFAEEIRKTFETAVHSHFEGDTPEQTQARKERMQQLTQHATELEATAKQMASDGKHELANVFLQKVLQLHERERAIARAGNADAERNAVLNSLQLEEQLLLERYGPDHPKVQINRKQAELIRKQIALEESSKQERHATPQAAESEHEGNEKQRRIEHLHQAAEHLAAAGLREPAEQIRKQATALAEAGNRGPSVHAAELRELHGQFRQLAERVERMEEMLRRIAEQQEQTHKALKATPERQP